MKTKTETEGEACESPASLYSRANYHRLPLKNLGSTEKAGHPVSQFRLLQFRLAVVYMLLVSVKSCLELGMTYPRRVPSPPCYLVRSNSDKILSS